MTRGPAYLHTQESRNHSLAPQGVHCVLWLDSYLAFIQSSFIMEPVEISVDLITSNSKWNSAKKLSGLTVHQTPQGHLRVSKVHFSPQYPHSQCRVPCIWQFCRCQRFRLLTEVGYVVVTTSSLWVMGASPWQLNPCASTKTTACHRNGLCLSYTSFPICVALAHKN